MGAKDFSFGCPNLLFPELTLAESIKIIQTAERARQGKLRAKYMSDIRIQALKEKELMAGENETGDESEKAVLKIQRLYRGYRARKQAKILMKAELEFLGMESVGLDPKSDPRVKSAENRDHRKLLQFQFEEDYLQALVTTKEKYGRFN
jgi:hypothetical protein